MADPFTGAVIEAGLESAATQMFEVLRKTAMSPIIYEVLDVGTGVTDASGALVSSGAGIPSFVGVLDKSVQAILTQEGGRVVPGDVFVTNDPNHGGVTHLNDVVVAEPVFQGETCIAWVASIAHWGDIGGRTPGSMSTQATEIVAEGLRLPIVRLFAGGERNAALFDIIRANSRLPDFVTGDLWAQVSAGRRAAGLIRALAERYGLAALDDAIAQARIRGEARARTGLATLPHGSFEIDAPQDDGDTWHAGIEITPERFTVDLREAPEQAAGPFNTSRDGAVIACQMLFKALTDPERFANAGSFAPLEVLTRPGTIFHAGPNAAHAYYFETRIRLFDMLWQCLARAMPGRLPAGHFASIFGTVIAGVHPQTGRRYAMVEPQMGGWGATHARPGQDAMFSTSHGDTFNCPVEIAEARYGFDVLEKRLAPAPDAAPASASAPYPESAPASASDPSSAPASDAESSSTPVPALDPRAAPAASRDGRREGQHAGGAGVLVRYRLRGAAVLSAGCSHARVQVWAVPPATPGGTNGLTLVRASGAREEHAMVSGLALAAGDVVEVRTAYGGSALAKERPG